MKNTFFIHVIHVHYIFHSCTVSENNGNLNVANQFLFGFLLFAFFYDNVILQLGVSLNKSVILNLINLRHLFPYRTRSSLC